MLDINYINKDVMLKLELPDTAFNQYNARG